MSSWRLPAPPQSDTATEGAANTFPVALRSMPVSTSTAALLWYIAGPNVPVWFSPEYLFDLIFR
jgi:hypothetical protein